MFYNDQLIISMEVNENLQTHIPLGIIRLQLRPMILKLKIEIEV